jgi:hypothetical protein
MQCLSVIGGVDKDSRGLADVHPVSFVGPPVWKFHRPHLNTVQSFFFLVTSATGWLKACSPHGRIIGLSKSCFLYEGVPSFTIIDQSVSLNRGALDCPPDPHPVLSHGPCSDRPNSEVQWSRSEMLAATRPF